jgi:hypothetical protein
MTLHVQPLPTTTVQQVGVVQEVAIIEDVKGRPEFYRNRRNVYVGRFAPLTDPATSEGWECEFVVVGHPLHPGMLLVEFFEGYVSEQKPGRLFAARVVRSQPMVQMPVLIRFKPNEVAQVRKFDELYIRASLVTSERKLQ